MASISRPRRAAELRSGGKIVRARRTVGPMTPYERPPRLLPNSGPQNPNWLSRLILSPTRMIATGAGKVLSSVFGPDSSSASSSSDGDFSSEGDMDDANDDNGISSQDANKLEENHTFDKINSLRKDPPAIEWKSETKRAIEQLLIQETFSREECDRLTRIIKSRVVDSPISGGIDGSLSEIPGKTVGSDVDIPDIRNTAITRAKKWVEEKKLGSNSKSELECGTCTLNTVMLPHVTEGEVGSPVDLAKSYMRARPPWTSPSISNIQLQSPSPMGIQLFKEETPHLFGGNSASSSKSFRDYSARGSWNILEEIRKVRSKATDEMLRTRSSSIIDWSTLALDNKRSPSSLVADKAESVSQIAQDGLQNGASPPDLAASVPEQSQGLGATQIMEGAEGLCDGSEGRLSQGQRLQPSEDMKAASQSGRDAAAAAAADGPKNGDVTCQPLNSTVGGDTQGSRSHEINCSTLEEVAGRNDAVAVNGFPSSGSSLSAKQQEEQRLKPSDEQHNPVDSGPDKMTRSAPIDEICEHLSEADVEVPIVHENDSAATGSQNSSSMHYEGLSQEPSPPNLKRKAGKSNEVRVTEKQPGGRRRYARKGKARGK